MMWINGDTEGIVTTWHDVKQGSPAWNQLRRGLPTASNFDKIVTSTGEQSKQRRRYLCGLAAELLGLEFTSISTAAMEYGRAAEPGAVQAYEMEYGVTTQEVGIVIVQDGNRRYGASPDRLIGDDGLLEIKCPESPTHIGYLIDKDGRGAYPDYKMQVQGQLLVTGRQWSDVMAYSPYLPPVIYRVERDEIFLQKLRTQLRIFCADLMHVVEKIRETPGFVKAA